MGRSECGAEGASRGSGAFTEEAERLGDALRRLTDALEDARLLHERIEGAYREDKRDQAQRRGELDPAERFQNELALAQTDRRAAQAFEAEQRLGKLLESPYFARVDFVPGAPIEGDRDPSENARTAAAKEAGASGPVSGGGAAPDGALPEAGDGATSASANGTAHYIGRFSYADAAGTLVSDWRSPIAALFYDFEPGPAAVEAPGGRIKGDLVLKRQIAIEDGRLASAIDAGTSVRDEVLVRELSRTTSNAMRSIISSIQKEQNALIRDEEPGTLVIQGVAGSGKTSIALHRIAYLLYRRKDVLTSRSVAIVSPNRVFGDYVSHVLPELGEEPVRQWSLRDIAQNVVGDAVSFEPGRSAVDDGDEAHRARAKLKGSLAFSDALRDFLAVAPDELFEGRDLSFGRTVVEGAALERRYRGYGGVAVDERIDLLAADVLRDLETSLIGRDRHALPKRGALRRALAGMLRAKDALALYRLFLRERGWADFFVRPAKGCAEWEDACPIALCTAAFSRVEAFGGVRHLVVDEMQDIAPVQHLMLSRLFGCGKTLLGDFNQALDDANEMRLENLGSLYADARAVELVRSYRSTCEIMAIAQRVRPVAGLVPVERHGEKPCIVACADTANVLANVRRIVRRFAESDRSTLCIVCKTDDLARRYYELLAAEAPRAHGVDGPRASDAPLPPLQLLAPDAETYAGGVSVASVAMAKGLEFDEVAILDADSRLYATEFDRNLLYVAVTRALHKLTLLHRGTPPRYLLE